MIWYGTVRIMQLPKLEPSRPDAPVECQECPPKQSTDISHGMVQQRIPQRFRVSPWLLYRTCFLDRVSRPCAAVHSSRDKSHGTCSQFRATLSDVNIGILDCRPGKVMRRHADNPQDNDEEEKPSADSKLKRERRNIPR